MDIRLAVIVVPDGTKTLWYDLLRFLPYARLVRWRVCKGIVDRHKKHGGIRLGVGMVSRLEVERMETRRSGKVQVEQPLGTGASAE